MFFFYWFRLSEPGSFCQKAYGERDIEKIGMLVNDLVVVEAKAVQELHPPDQAEPITHLELYDRRLRHFINFNVVLLKDGFRRIVNNRHYANK